jgi:hypothetical protein
VFDRLKNKFVIMTAFVFYFPLYPFFGGFDEYSLGVYKKAVALTGPSILFTWPFYKLFAWGYRHSPFNTRTGKYWNSPAFGSRDVPARKKW